MEGCPTSKERMPWFQYIRANKILKLLETIIDIKLITNIMTLEKRRGRFWNNTWVTKKHCGFMHGRFAMKIIFLLRKLMKIHSKRKSTMVLVDLQKVYDSAIISPWVGVVEEKNSHIYIFHMCVYIYSINVWKSCQQW